MFKTNYFLICVTSVVQLVYTGYVVYVQAKKCYYALSIGTYDTLVVRLE